jgi:hypothetical protein
MIDGDRESSPAWAVVPKSARKVYDIISTTIAAGDGDSAQISHLDFMFDHHTGAPAPSLRMLRYLRLIEVVPGKVGCYRLTSGWREIDTTMQAERPTRQPQGGAVTRRSGGMKEAPPLGKAGNQSQRRPVLGDAQQPRSGPDTDSVFTGAVQR